MDLLVVCREMWMDNITSANITREQRSNKKTVCGMQTVFDLSFKKCED